MGISTRSFITVLAVFGLTSSVAHSTPDLVIDNPTEAIALADVDSVEVDPKVFNTLVAVSSGPPARFLLVGFTRATFTGALGGHFGVTQKCQFEFPRSRMCTLEGARSAREIRDELSGEAWVHTLSVSSERPGALFDAVVIDGSRNCGAWTTTAARGTTVGANGGPDPEQNCDQEYPIACCAPVP